MTTTVGNNSVYRCFFEKQKLTGPNFIDWYRQLHLVLSTEDKENYLEHLIPVALPGQQVPPEALAAHAAWVKGQKEVVVLMLLTMDLEIQRNLAHLGAYDMLQELKVMFSKQAEQELLQTMREFHACKQEEGQSVSSYVLKMMGYIDNLERLGQPIDQNLAVSLILVSLNKDYDSFVQNYNMHGMGKTVNELHAMLKLHENTLPKKDVNPALHAIRAGRVQKNQKINRTKLLRGVMDAICHQCDEIGHWRRNCPVYLAELMKKKKLSQGASTSGQRWRGDCNDKCKEQEEYEVRADGHPLLYDRYRIVAAAPERSCGCIERVEVIRVALVSRAPSQIQGGQKEQRSRERRVMSSQSYSPDLLQHHATVMVMCLVREETSEKNIETWTNGV
ncbi:zinc finger, CCHC-type containing protein [Tanacetum coccineum]|uniref:Zinc finger, CCHC-type containing protein n=1 Tax=Tanacetum coccineum TaxID=301880 RepID=A0ABQ4YVS0_9ASTR